MRESLFHADAMEHRTFPTIAPFLRGQPQSPVEGAVYLADKTQVVFQYRLEAILCPAQNLIQTTNIHVAFGIAGDGIGHAGRVCRQTIFLAIGGRVLSRQTHQGLGSQPDIFLCVLGDSIAILHCAAAKSAVFGQQVVHLLAVEPTQQFAAPAPDVSLPIFEQEHGHAGGQGGFGEAVKSGAVVPADPAVYGGEPESTAPVAQHVHHLVAAQTISTGEGYELLSVEAADAAVGGGEPEESIAVLFDVFDLMTGQAVGRGIGAPVGVAEGVFSGEIFAHGSRIFGLLWVRSSESRTIA